MTITVRNLRYSSPDNSSVDLEIEHPEYGWIPFTATPDDTEQHGRDIYEAALAGEYGQVAPYVAPPPTTEPVPSSVTRRQGRLALLQVGKLDVVEEAIEGNQQGLIEYEADTWERSNPFLQMLWAQLGGTEAELDALFILASEK